MKKRSHIHAGLNRSADKATVGVIQSDSMYPTLYKEDKVLLHKAPKDEINKGDIIGFVSDNKRILVHRVLYKTKANLQTIADNSTRIDAPISYENIVGKATMVKVKDSWYYIKRGVGLVVVGKAIAFLSDLVILFPRSSVLVRVRRVFSRVAKLITFRLLKSH